MGRLINTTAMTVDGVIDVSDWFVAQGDHDAASLALFDDDAALLLGRKTYAGLAGFWPTQTRTEPMRSAHGADEIRVAARSI